MKVKVLVLQTVLTAPFFVWYSRFSTFEWKSFSDKNPVIIVPNFETGVNHCVPYDVILFYHNKRCGKSITCSPRASSGFEKCTAIFVASFAGLLWALQAPCGVASNWKERHGSTPQIYTTLDHILTHLLVSPWLIKNMQFFRVDQTVLHVDRSLLGCCGQFRRPIRRILLHIYRWKYQ